MAQHRCSAQKLTEGRPEVLSSEQHQLTWQASVLRDTCAPSTKLHMVIMAPVLVKCSLCLLSAGSDQHLGCSLKSAEPWSPHPRCILREIPLGFNGWSVINAECSVIDTETTGDVRGCCPCSKIAKYYVQKVAPTCPKMQGAVCPCSKAAEWDVW